MNVMIFKYGKRFRFAPSFNKDSKRISPHCAQQRRPDHVIKVELARFSKLLLSHFYSLKCAYVHILRRLCARPDRGDCGSNQVKQQHGGEKSTFMIAVAYIQLKFFEKKAFCKNAFLCIYLFFYRLIIQGKYLF